MSRLTVRRASPADALHMASLNAVVQQLHHDAHPDRFPAPDRVATEQVFASWLRSSLSEEPVMRSWLCEDGEPIGYLVGVLRERPATPFTHAWRWIELDQIAVRPNSRRTGAAQMLVEAFMTWVDETQVDVIELSVWAFNVGAQSFFDHAGFTPLQHRMVRRLSRS